MEFIKNDFRKLIAIYLIVWIILIAITFFWAYKGFAKEQKTIALQTAKAFFYQISTILEWSIKKHEEFYAETPLKIQSDFQNKNISAQDILNKNAGMPEPCM